MFERITVASSCEHRETYFFAFEMDRYQFTYKQAGSRLQQQNTPFKCV